MKEPSSIAWGEHLWPRLKSAEADEICRRSGAGYLPTGGFTLSFLSRQYRVDLQNRTVAGPQADNPELQLLLLTYLLQAQVFSLEDKWISEKELSGGSLFFQGPHRLPDNILCTRFGKDLSAFAHACQSLGGLPLAFGDGSFALQVLPRIKLGCVLWTADDEFPARFSFLFTPCIQQHLPLDVIFALANVVTGVLLDTKVLNS